MMGEIDVLTRVRHRFALPTLVWKFSFLRSGGPVEEVTLQGDGAWQALIDIKRPRSIHDA